MSDTTKAQQFGPDQPRGPVSASRHRLAQGQHAVESRVPQHGVPGLQHLEHGITEPRPTESVTLTATVPHHAQGNAMYTDLAGQAPHATVAIADAASAATELGKPSDFRSAPAGARGMDRGDWHTAPINGGQAVQPRPAGPAAVPFSPDAMAGMGGGGGQLQGHSPDVGPPGWQFSTRAPNDGQSRFGRGNPAA